MVFEMAFLSETFLTILTLMWFLFGMSSKLCFENAIFTLIWFLFCMR